MKNETKLIVITCEAMFDDLMFRMAERVKKMDETGQYPVDNTINALHDMMIECITESKSEYKELTLEMEKNPTSEAEAKQLLDSILPPVIKKPEGPVQ